MTIKTLAALTVASFSLLSTVACDVEKDDAGRPDLVELQSEIADEFDLDYEPDVIVYADVTDEEELLERAEDERASFDPTTRLTIDETEPDPMAMGCMISWETGCLICAYCGTCTANGCPDCHVGHVCL